VRKAAAVLLLAVALLLIPAVPSDAWGHAGHGHPGFRHAQPGFRSRVFIGVGPAFWWGPPYPYWWYYPYSWYYPPYYVYPSPPVVVQEPPVYVQPSPAPPQSYWYYCPSAAAYYPSVQTCPEAWIKVPPRSQ